MRLGCSAGILFYCHFPDKLLAKESGGFLRKGIYRKVFDWAEEWCLAHGAHKIVVNSKFTQSIFIKEFKRITQIPQVLYPSIDLSPYQQLKKLPVAFPDGLKVFVSLNRFERKKDLHLAIEAFKSTLRSGTENLRLIVAGGYDERVKENREHLLELERLCQKLDLSYKTTTNYAHDFSQYLTDTKVLFLPSITQETKSTILKSSFCLLYTPSNEHFGIVPLEAMSQSLPVIAINSGGPRETVIDSVGYLCEPTSEDMSRCMRLVLKTGKEAFSGKGPRWVESKFSISSFSQQLITAINSIKSSD
jgi:alpha-1,3/alpha-1,6-mannosyltransferase